MRGRGAHRVAAAGVVAGAVLLLVLLALPIGALLLRGGPTGLAQLGADAELRGSLWLTAQTATVATLLTVLLGTPLAYLLARDRMPLGGFVGALLDLPLLVPHPVAAPLYVSAAREAIARVDVRYESVARTLGDSPLRAAWRVTRPLAGRGLLAAAVVMWARAVSEFGAIVILTYNPKVASVLSYDRFTGEGLDAALPVAAVLVILALVPLLVLRSLRSGAATGEPAR